MKVVVGRKGELGGHKGDTRNCELDQIEPEWDDSEGRG